MKRCIKCGIIKEDNQFHKKYHRGVKFKSTCRECGKGRKAEWQRENNKICNGYKIKWRENNKEKANELTRNWKRANPEKSVEYKNRRRARKNSSKGNFSSKEWLLIKYFYDNKCLACGREEPEIRLTQDHIVPISLGGDNAIGNIQPLCGKCNSSKHIKIIDYRNGRIVDTGPV